MADEVVRCPWCAEEILAEARKCKHCGEFLDEESKDVGQIDSVFPQTPPPSFASPSAPATPAAAPIPRGDAGIMCPHCQVRGGVRTKSIKQKKGLSGGKATAAVFTMGISMLGTGLSRKEKVTEAKCGNCKAV